MTPDDVPSGPLLVDTDVVSDIAWRRARYAEFEPFVVGRAVAMSFASVGELYMGAERAGWGAERRGALDLVIRRYTVLLPTDSVAREFGRIYAKFRDNFGRSGQNDCWTAACALAQSPPTPILTNNRIHFEAVAREFPALFVVHPDR